MRLISYNVSGGLDPAAVGRILAAQQPDVVCLTEIPPAGRLRAITRAAALDIVVRAGRRGTGTAILASGSVRVRATDLVPLTSPRDVPSRQASHAIIGVAGLGLSVTAVQFGLRPEVRRTNLDELLDYLDSIEQPSVIGADLNESIPSPVAAGLAARLQDAHAVAGTGTGLTYPASDPSTRQDFVFVDRSLTVHRAVVLTDPPVRAASHPRPVVVDLAGPGDDGEPAG